MSKYKKIDKLRDGKQLYEIIDESVRTITVEELEERKHDLQLNISSLQKEIEKLDAEINGLRKCK
jgi:FtsZ-binding cell division protein ZapB